MKSTRLRFSGTVGLLTLLVCSYHAFAQEDNTVLDRPGVVKSSAEMRYPPMARQARIQGDVVVRIKLDDAGQVVSAKALSGAKLLIDDAVSNSKKWRFLPNSGDTVVVIYEFRIIEGKCDVAKSHFVFREPNIATVTGCADKWQP